MHRKNLPGTFVFCLFCFVFFPSGLQLSMRLVLWRIPGLTHFFQNEGEEGFDSSTIPNLFEQWCAFFNVPQEPDKCKCCETGPTVFPPYPRRLESLTVCRCHYTKTALSSQLFKDPECWSGLTRSADWHSPNWATQAAVKWYLCFPFFFSFLVEFFAYIFIKLVVIALYQQFIRSDCNLYCQPFLREIQNTSKWNLVTRYVVETLR